MHILFLTDNFPPEVNAPASRTYEHCLEWIRSGHQVTVVTCFPNFPTGKIYPGFRNRPWRWEEMDGIRVLRVWSYISANKGFIKRTLDYISYMVSASLAAPWVRKPDVVIGTSPQFFTVCAAWLVSRIRRVPFIFELRDLWPESIKAVGAMKDSLPIRLLEKLELFLYHQAAAVVSVTRSFREILIKRGIDEGKIHVVTNGLDPGRFKPMEKDRDLVREHHLDGRFVAGYIGTHGLAHSLETLLEAAGMLAADPDGADVTFLFLGDGANKSNLVSRAGELGLENVVFVDSVPKSEVVRYWSLLDVSVIHLKKTDLFRTVIPSKIFESMGMELPILLGVQGESADIVRSTGVGEAFEPENARELARRLLALKQDNERYQDMKRHCAEAAKQFDRANLAQKMLAIIETQLS
jgi:glycosyltransferase involved in cell wall biosynthesis